MDNGEADAAYPLGDLSWMKPYIEEARASVRLGKAISLAEHRRRMKKYLADAADRGIGLGGLPVEAVKREGG
jgi:hypothetical protein